MVRICERCLNPEVNVLELEVYGGKFPNNRSVLSSTIKPRLIFTMATEASASKGIEIDWGDGSKEKILPNVREFQFGEPLQYNGYITHTFPDGEVKWRSIKIKFLGGLDNLERYYSEYICYRGTLFPSLGRAINLKTLYLYSCRGKYIELSEDSHFKLEGFDSIAKEILRLKALSSFTSHFAWKVGSVLNDKIPLEFFNTSIKTLTYGGGVSTQFQDSAINNFDKLPILSGTLTNFSSNYSGLKVSSFPENWSANTSLTGLNMLGFNAINSSISKLLLQNLQKLTLQSDRIGDPLNNNEWLKIPDNSELLSLTLLGSLNDPSKLPVNLYKATKLKFLNFGHPTVGLLRTTEQVTAWWNNWYTFITTFASMNTNDPDQEFRGITFDFRGGSVGSPIEMPNGYVQGVSNGTPTTTGQKIWVLSNQYGHHNSYTP